jgi:ferredoxin
VCPAGLITLTDQAARRTVRFAAVCAEDCALCVPACPEGAITLTPGAPGAETTVGFDLLLCDACHTPFLTAPILVKLRAGLATAIGPTDPSWLTLCPACRQAKQGQEMAGVRP